MYNHEHLEKVGQPVEHEGSLVDSILEAIDDHEFQDAMSDYAQEESMLLTIAGILQFLTTEQIAAYYQELTDRKVFDTDTRLQPLIDQAQQVLAMRRASEQFESDHKRVMNALDEESGEPDADRGQVSNLMRRAVLGVAAFNMAASSLGGLGLANQQMFNQSTGDTVRNINNSLNSPFFDQEDDDGEEDGQQETEAVTSWIFTPDRNITIRESMSTNSSEKGAALKDTQVLLLTDPNDSENWHQGYSWSEVQYVTASGRVIEGVMAVGVIGDKGVTLWGTTEPALVDDESTPDPRGKGEDFNTNLVEDHTAPRPSLFPEISYPDRARDELLKFTVNIDGRSVPIGYYADLDRLPYFGEDSKLYMPGPELLETYKKAYERAFAPYEELGYIKIYSNGELVDVPLDQIERVIIVNTLGVTSPIGRDVDPELPESGMILSKLKFESAPHISDAIPGYEGFTATFTPARGYKMEVVQTGSGYEIVYYVAVHPNAISSGDTKGNLGTVDGPNSEVGEHIIGGLELPFLFDGVHDMIDSGMSDTEILRALRNEDTNFRKDFFADPDNEDILEAVKTKNKLSDVVRITAP